MPVAAAWPGGYSVSALPLRACDDCAAIVLSAGSGLGIAGLAGPEPGPRWPAHAGPAVPDPGFS